VKHNRVMMSGVYDGEPEIVRLSTVLKRLRANGKDDAARDIEESYRRCGDNCPIHGHLADPVFAIMQPDKLVFACPDCSDPVVKEAWEAEGRRETPS
jgi:hypothetical protein